jgi:hypothetical protein
MSEELRFSRSDPLPAGSPRMGLDDSRRGLLGVSTGTFKSPWGDRRPVTKPMSPSEPIRRLNMQARPPGKRNRRTHRASGSLPNANGHRCPGPVTTHDSAIDLARSRARPTPSAAAIAAYRPVRRTERQARRQTVVVRTLARRASRRRFEWGLLGGPNRTVEPRSCAGCAVGTHAAPETQG